MNEELLYYAFRYALGRRTYAVDTVAREIIHYAPQLSEKTKALMREEIDKAYRVNGLGDQCDVDNWHRVRAVIT